MAKSKYGNDVLMERQILLSRSSSTEDDDGDAMDGGWDGDVSSQQTDNQAVIVIVN